MKKLINEENNEVKKDLYYHSKYVKCFRDKGARFLVHLLLLRCNRLWLLAVPLQLDG